jgi:biotin transport system ATP-binding protein
MNIIEIENLSHYFADGTMGLEDINLKIEAGSFIVVAGRNGSGKTTLFRHLNGLLLPSRGTVRVDGVSVAENPARARRMVGMVFQDADSQIVCETVHDDVAFGPENLCMEREEVKTRVSRALKAVGLTGLANQRPHLLSGGEKRRLTIAGIIAMEPGIVVFDEPFTSLDYPGVRQVLKQILALHRAGCTILITTQDLEKVIAHADRLIIMMNGKVVKDSSPENIIKETEAFGVRAPCATRYGMEIVPW